MAVPWTNVYGTARSAVALGTLVTLLLHDSQDLFRPFGTSIADQASRDFFVRWSIFLVGGDARLELARWLCIGALILVVIGWRPRWTALPHWWISWSFAGSSMVVNGGEQVATVLTFFLLPIALTDPRKWHWSSWIPPQRGMTVGWHLQHVAAMGAVVVLRLQVALIYFEAAVSKLSVEEWKNGTALYYWFTNPGFGMPDWLAPFITPIITNRYGVTTATWGVVAFETTLFLALTMPRGWRRLLLPFGILFHFGILIVHGLGIFFLSMLGALILYLWPLEDAFRLQPMHAWVENAFALLQRRDLRCRHDEAPAGMAN
jgi:antimicrobial peptide system SdpB family protein